MHSVNMCMHIVNVLSAHKKYLRRAHQSSVYKEHAEAPPSGSFSGETAQSSPVTEPLFLWGHSSKTALSTDTGVEGGQEGNGGQ